MQLKFKKNEGKNDIFFNKCEPIFKQLSYIFCFFVMDSIFYQNSAQLKHNEVVPYSDAEQDKKSQVTSMFDKIAPYYDFLNRLLTVGIDQRWRKKAIATLGNQHYSKILDIATGTADLPVMMKKRLNVDEIVGLDISPKMIELAKKKISEKGLSDTVSLEVGDSERLRFEDNQFQAATASFGVRNFSDLQQGLNEIYRVLDNRGKLMILEFSKPTIFPFKQLFNMYFKFILPAVGKLTSKDPKAYKYLYESVQAFPDYEDMADIIRKSGFTNVKYTPLTLGICTIYTGEK